MQILALGDEPLPFPLPLFFSFLFLFHPSMRPPVNEMTITRVIYPGIMENPNMMKNNAQSKNAICTITLIYN